LLSPAGRISAKLRFPVFKQLAGSVAFCRFTFNFFNRQLPLSDILLAKRFHPGPVMLLTLPASIPAVQTIDGLLIPKAVTIFNVHDPPLQIRGLFAAPGAVFFILLSPGHIFKASALKSNKPLIDISQELVRIIGLEQFFVPKGATYDDIIVEYKYEGVPRNLASHKVEGSIRYRMVDSYKLNKIGKWTITIKKGLTVLKAFDVNVIEK
jgi:hypothetical protein